MLDGRGRAFRANDGYAAWERSQQVDRAPKGSAGPAARTEKPTRARSASTLGRLLRDAEKAIAERQRARNRLAEELSDAGSDHEALARIGRALAAVDAEIAEMEEEWLSIAAEAESTA